MPAFVAAPPPPSCARAARAARPVCATSAFTPTGPRARVARVAPSPLESTACAKPPISDEPPPTSVEETAARAAAALDAALASGMRRVRVTALVPGLNPIAEDTFPFNAALQAKLARALVAQSKTLRALPDARLLFASAGEAAAAAALFARESASESASESDASAAGDGEDADTDDDSQCAITTNSFSGRDFVDGRASQHVNVLVSPISSRGDPVLDDLERVQAEADDAVWVLFNDRLDVDRAAVGIGESTRRAAYVASFGQAFYFRNLFEIKRPRLVAVERGALVFAFGGAWTVFGLVDDEYVAAGVSDDMPAPAAVDSMVRRARGVAAQRQKRMREEAARVAGESGGGFGSALKRLFGG